MAVSRMFSPEDKLICLLHVRNPSGKLPAPITPGSVSAVVLKMRVQQNDLGVLFEGVCLLRAGVIFKITSMAQVLSNQNHGQHPVTCM